MAPSWSDILDSLAAQIELQERCLLGGHRGPGDLDIDPPDQPLDPFERVRAIELFERCERLLDVATERAVAARGIPRSPYRRGGTT